MTARQPSDHAAQGTRRDITLALVIGAFLATGTGFGLGVAHERSSQPDTVVVPVDRTERTAACRCAERGADE